SPRPHHEMPDAHAARSGSDRRAHHAAPGASAPGRLPPGAGAHQGRATHRRALRRRTKQRRHRRRGRADQGRGTAGSGAGAGARIFASTRAMAPTGMYPIVSTNWELELPHGVEPVDGVDGARRAVREQVAHGADWIKYYSDRRYYFTPDSVLHSWVNFTDEEAKAIVDEAHRLGRKVAAH